MRKFRKIAAAVLACILLVLSLAACGSSSDTIEIAVPNDTTNEARALQLLEKLGYITLEEGAGITATAQDIAENPYGITIREVEAAQIPNILEDVDFGIINSNYAIEAGLNPVEDALALEDSYSQYVNVLVVKEGNEETDETKALVAALCSQKVADFINSNYDGAVISTVENPGDGFDDTVDYDSLSGTTISVAASPTPHAEILEVAAEILAEKNITLDIQEFTDYVQPNNVVESGEVYANYFQHEPYLDDFNEENGTHLVAVAGIHVEPMGIYAGKSTSLDVFSSGN
ncbi:MAG: MetQ/NlpA family ABC transporter substrate-binding protein [Oscillospiraceae bacterium]